MLIALIIILFVLSFGFLIITTISYSDGFGWASLSCFLVGITIVVYGCFNGFVDYPPTEGTHQGIITAVDLEGVYFRRYEVYLKSSGYTAQSDETVYKIYEYEKDLAEELKKCIGKEVKLNYGHDGGYIGWKSCGTYHIESVEVIEKEQENEY